MTKKNLIIVIILLTVIDLVAAGWYMTRRIEASGRSQNLFEQHDSTEAVTMADTVTSAFQADVFDDLQHNTYYYIANDPSVNGDNSSYYTSIKHVKVRWPKKVNGNDNLTELNKELISKAFGNTQSQMKDARYVYLNTPTFNKPIGEGDYHKLTKAPKTLPIYGNVSQVLVYPYMTSQRLLVMEIDKVEYNGSSTIENSSFIHYDRQNQHILSRPDILVTDFEKENKLLKALNKKIDNLNKGRGDNKLQHALNVPAEICCSKNGINFQFKHGTISSSTIEIQLDYDKMEQFLTKDFKQLLENNEGYSLYNDNIKPEPINETPKVEASPAAVKPVKKKTKSYNYNSGKYNYYKNKKKYSRRGQSRQKRYNGATRKSERYGSTGRRHWKHRRH